MSAENKPTENTDVALNNKSAPISDTTSTNPGTTTAKAAPESKPSPIVSPPANIIVESEKIGIIGSPSSNVDLAIDILGSAAGKKLIGELAYFYFSQDNKPHYAIGQITGVRLNNTLIEDATMKNLIRDKGTIESISGIQDTYRGNISISAVFGEDNDKYFPSMIGTVPPTGTFLNLVTVIRSCIWGEFMVPLHGGRWGSDILEEAKKAPEKLTISVFLEKPARASQFFRKR